MTKEEIEKLIEEHAHSHDFGCRKDCDCAWCTMTKVAVALRHLLSVNERLTEALKPFVRWADEFKENDGKDSRALVGNYEDPEAWRVIVTLGDLRRARAALEAA